LLWTVARVPASRAGCCRAALRALPDLLDIDRAADFLAGGTPPARSAAAAVAGLCPVGRARNGAACRTHRAAALRGVCGDGCAAIAGGAVCPVPRHLGWTRRKYRGVAQHP